MRRTRSTKTVYKVVRKYSGMLTSLYFGAYEPPCVLYTPQKWSRARLSLRKHRYGLCVFGTLQDVYHFTYDTIVSKTPRRDLQVWECEAIGVRKPRVDRLSVGDVVPLALGKLDLSKAMRDAWPTGTLHADAVRLVKPVPWRTVRLMKPAQLRQ